MEKLLGIPPFKCADDCVSPVNMQRVTRADTNWLADMNTVAVWCCLVKSKK